LIHRHTAHERIALRFAAVGDPYTYDKNQRHRAKQHPTLLLIPRHATVGVG